MTYPGSIVISPERDIPLLRQVRNSRFVSHQQLFELLDQNGDAGSCRDAFRWRVRRLFRTGYIRRLEALAWQGSPVYSIAPAGLMELESQGDCAIALNSKTRNMPHRLQVFHALELNAIRIALGRNARLVSWESEIEIASSNMVSPSPYQKDYDAVVKLWADGEVRDFALEYERSLKSTERYAKIRAALEGERQVSSVVYLTASPDITLALIYQLTPLAIPIAFATARSFREQNLATSVSIDASGRTVPLASFLEYASSFRVRLLES